MASKLQDIEAMLSTLNKCELEWVKSLARQAIQAQPPPTSCKLLDLPAELRNEIYRYVATFHVYNCRYDDRSRCGLMSANKQLRTEFLDVFYSKQIFVKIEVATAVYDTSTTPSVLKDLSWKSIDSRKLVKAILDGGEHMELFDSHLEEDEVREDVRRYLRREGFRRVKQRRWPNAILDLEPCVYGIMELAGDHDCRFRSFYFEKKTLEKTGLGQELSILDTGLTLSDEA